MAYYDIMAKCQECGQSHNVSLGVEIARDFEVWTVSSALREGILSPAHVMMISRIKCPITGKDSPAESDHMILVAVRDNQSVRAE